MVARRTVKASPPKPVDSSNQEVNDLQRQVAEIQRQFNPFAQGELIEWKGKAGFQTFKHGLGRVPSGVINMGCTVALTTDVHAPGIKASDKASITIGVGSTLCDGKVWVY